MKIIDEQIIVDFGNGETVLLENEVTWQEIRDYINRKFEWLASKPTRRSFKDDHSEPEASQPEASQPETEPSLNNNVPGSLTIRKINYLLWVLGQSGGRLRSIEAYEKMKQVGYSDNSSDSLTNVVSKARKYADLVALYNGCFELTAEGWNAFEQLKEGKLDTIEEIAQAVIRETAHYSDEDVSYEEIVAEVAQSEVTQSKVPAIDCLLRALDKNGGSARLEDLVGPMLDEGWETQSDTPSKRRRSISATASTYRKYVDVERGQVTINVNGYMRLTALKEANLNALAEMHDSFALGLYEPGPDD